jgi:hypothetical protein
MPVIEYTAPNGEKIMAPLWIWVTALVEALSPEQKQKFTEMLAAQVKQISPSAVIHPPGQYHMKAETGIYDSKKH